KQDKKRVELSQEERKCLQVLRTSGYEQFKDRNPDRLKGTCQWFLQHKHFQKWRESNSSSLLWVSADPGCGKSVLSKSLADNDLKGTEARVTCYFFFKDDNKEQKSVTSALSALLHQLFSQKQLLIHYAMLDYTAEGNRLPQSFHKLWNILIKATTDLKAGEVVCILDALDECEESGRYEIISALNAFYKKVTSSKENLSKLKFLVTSRPYLDIERRFTKLTHDFPTIRLQGEKESEAISREINIVIKWRIANLGPELNLDDLEQSTLEDGLLSMTNRTYLWSKLIFDIIRDEIELSSTKLKEIIGTLPSTVDQAYEAILSRIRDRERPRAQKLLRIIVAAKRPLTLQEMNIALAIEDHHRSYEDLDLKSEARFETTVRNLCGLFVSVIDQRVYLIHQTAKEFLIAKSEAVVDRWQHSIDLVASELLMARTCIIYLMFTTENHGYLSYAARFWATHYRQAQKRATDEILQSVLKICDTHSPRFQNWFNVYWNMVHPYISTPGFTSSIMVGSYFGHDAVVKLLLETGKVEVDSKDNEYGQTPLSWAAENGHEAVVKLLLETGKVEVDSRDNEYGRTPLSWAAENGHEAVVKLLLETGKVEVDLKDNKYGQTPLSWAAEKGHEAVVKLLLETGKVEVDPKSGSGRTPLSWAAGNGHEAMVKLLLETGKVEVNSKDKWSGRTPLSWAAENGHEAVVKLLIETGKVEVNSKDNEYGRTPLSWAAKNGHEAVVKLLLETGKVEVDSKDNEYGQTPLSWAAEKGHEAVVKLLLETGKVEVDSKDNRSGLTPLSWAAKNGHEAVVKPLLETGKVEVNSKDNEYGQTPLSWAAENGHEAVVKLLLETGKVEVDSKDNEYGQTPLSWAAWNGHEAVVRLLQSFCSS
ncbi:ankyrin, partial [Cenococcum geophilum 1.58]|uniref:ankyrin n=1 Tax=Cenococcum geophilum 1.58 TaxID=794803 RepID=UPI00358EA779